MKALLQRVRAAHVEVDGTRIGETGPGLMILVCAMQGDTAENARQLAAKTARLRIFADEQGRMNRSLLDTGGSALVISQFTLAADTSRGNRPGFSAAAPPDEGKTLYETYAEALRSEGITTQTGRFGADMQVTLTNDGPVTILLER